MGKRCEKRGSTKDTIVIAVSSTVTVFAVMLIITLISVYCTRRKYRKKASAKTAAMNLENVSRVFRWLWNHMKRGWAFFTYIIISN